jgi:hypothetical protein
MEYNQEFGESNLNQFLIDYHILGYDTILPSGKLSTSQISENSGNYPPDYKASYTRRQESSYLLIWVINIKYFQNVFIKITDKVCMGR